MDMPVVKQDDIELSIDLHDGFAWPGLIPPAFPPMEAKWWVHLAGAKICWVSDQGNWGFMSSGNPSSNVYINDKKAINSMHDIGFFVPHLWIPFVNIPGAGLVNLLIPLTIALSQAQVLLGCSSVLVNDNPIGVGPWPAVNCSDPVPTPFGAFIPITDVKVGVTWADALEALKQYAIQVALALVIAGVTAAGGAAWKKFKAKKLAKLGSEAAEKGAKEVAERAARESAQETAEKISKEAGEHATNEAREKAFKELMTKNAAEATEEAGRKGMIESAERGVKETAQRSVESAAREAEEHAAREALEKGARETSEQGAERAEREAAEQAAREAAEREAAQASREAAEQATSEAASHAEREAAARAEQEAADEAADRAAREASEAASREAAANEAKDAASKAHQEAVDNLKRLQDERAACGIFDGAKKRDLDVAIKNAEFAVEGATRDFAAAAEREAAERAAKEAAQNAGREALESAEQAAARAASEQAAKEAAQEAAEKASREAAEHAGAQTAAREAREAAEKTAGELKEKAAAAARREAEAAARKETAEQAAAKARRQAEEASRNELLSQAEKDRLLAEADRMTREAEEAAVAEQAAREAREASMEAFEKADKELSERLAKETEATAAREAADLAYATALQKQFDSEFQKATKQYANWGEFKSAYGLKLLKFLKLSKKFIIPLKALLTSEEEEADQRGHIPMTTESVAQARLAAHLMALELGQNLLGPNIISTGEEPDEASLSAIERGLLDIFGPEEGANIFQLLQSEPAYVEAFRQAFNGPVTDMAEQLLRLELYGAGAFSGHELCDIGIPHSLHPYV